MAAANTSKNKKKGSIGAVICRIFGTLILIAVIVSLLPITVPRFMGYQIFNVVSGSMEPEIPVGSVVYVKGVDPLQIAEGDIIAFSSGGSVVMHRVVGNHQVDGYLTTKGDANEIEDMNDVAYTSVIGRVVKHFPVLGQVMMIYAGTLGKILLLCFALCGALLHILAARLRG